ncbi:hypothetical protein EW146_g5776 [Bondarzewia mesenterica]|uniref:Galactose oxidase n=1 Tax=Bondarzewia mesenterica TaxID=1095465 RepID=A0A4S4LQF7_9AGAM|nr:hypothetical protein EW146_g5776 [Bondarzewia mesenterica]
MHVVTLPSSGIDVADYFVVPPQPEADGAEVPAPRVGHTASVIHDKIFIFGGRGGKEMTPLPENGRVWVFSTKTSKWSHLDPATDSAYPEPRSYHASASTAHAIPPYDKTSPSYAGDHESGTLFIHAGCPSSGRLADTWAFDIASRTWSTLPSAPSPPRGGTALEFAQNRLWRFGGFDGKSELGGAIEYLDLASASSNQEGGAGARWQSVGYGTADGEGPGARSVAGLHLVSAGQGRSFLLSFLGERDPSSKGHDGAGKFWGDVWAYQLKAEGLTGATIVDAAKTMFGRGTGEGKWSRVEVSEVSDILQGEGQQTGPGERGWFASATMADFAPASVLIWGGLNGRNEREGDGFVLSVE